nr:phospholipase-like protein [Tanacetum cinerariifolium]
MDLSDYEAPCVLVTYRINNLQIQFEREEFCLVNGLRFRVECWADYDNDEDPIPFRQRMFPSSLYGEHITCKIVETLIDSKLFDRLHNDDAVSLCYVGILLLVFLGVEGRRIVPHWILRLANDRFGWEKYPWGSYVWPTLYSQLKDVDVKRWPSLYAGQPIDEVDRKSYSIFGFTWAFKVFILKGNLRVATLTLDDTEARYDWWVSSRAYFEGVIDQAERVREANKGPIIVNQHYGISDFSEFQSNQNIPNRGKREQRPSMYRRTPYMEQAPTTVLPKQRGNKNKNKVQKATVLPLNPRNVFDDDNEGSDDIMFVGGQFTGNMLAYANVDPNKVRRDNYVNLAEFLNNSYEIYLDCYMKGWNVFDDDNEGSDDIIFVGGQFTDNMLVYENVNPNKELVPRMESAYTCWDAVPSFLDLKRDITERGHTISWEEMRIRSPDRLLSFPSGFPLGMVPPKNLDKRNDLFPHDSVLTIYNGLRAPKTTSLIAMYAKWPTRVNHFDHCIRQDTAKTIEEARIKKQPNKKRVISLS